MNFELSEEQTMLKDTVERLMSRDYSFQQRQAYAGEADGWSRALWARYAELGLLALPFDAEHGGLDYGPVEMMIVQEAMGRALVLEPYNSTVVVAGAALRAAASGAQLARWVPRIAAGELLVVLAHAERQSRYNLADVGCTATPDGDGYRLSGAKVVVAHGEQADLLLVSARVEGQRTDRDGICLFMVDAAAAGVTRRGYRTQDGVRAADITLDAVRVDAVALVGQLGRALAAIERAADVAIAALCAEAVGAMAAAQDMTVDYLKTRTQFGSVIGNFQALQHRAAEMLVALEQARSMAMYAALMVDEPDLAERRKALSAVKVQIGKSARFIGQQAIQLHGGIGVTEEYAVGHYFKRLTVLETQFGDTGHHLARLAAAGGLIGVN
jgi:pimeloyl-CoA dehydrogenase small subunit